ncbi:MAG: pyruvate formate lyase family protein [Anaerolineae bacterium]
MITCKPATSIRELTLSKGLSGLKEELLNAPHTHSTLNSRLVRESLAQSAGQAPVLRRARSLAKVFEQMPIYIREGELLVGNRSEGLGVMPVQLGVTPRAAVNCLEPVDAAAPEQCAGEAPRDYMLDEDAGMQEYYMTLVNQQVQWAEEELMAGFPPGRIGGFGHILADYALIAAEGALPLADKAHRYCEHFTSQGLARQADFCRASEIALRGLVHWGQRYAALAAQLANECADPARRAELVHIAEICAQVPAQPARNFYEALQSIWFCHQAMFIEQVGGSISFGNLDQVLAPFYDADLANGRITRATAEELCDSFFIKTMENAIWPRENVNFTHMSLGGQDLAGNDLTNEVSWMLLDSLAKVRSTHPLLSMRWHPNSDQDFWLRCIECLSLGMGLPALFGDEQIINAMVLAGIPREEAVNYGIVGCVEPAIRGKYHGQTLGGHMNVLKCLELALNDGVSLTSGRQLGLQTGNLKDFTSFEQLFVAYSQQVLNTCHTCNAVVEAAAKVQEDIYGYALMSSMMEGAIENGRDLSMGARYNNASMCVTGVTNVVDALMAIDELAFKQRRRTCNELWEAMRANFVGYGDVLRDIQVFTTRFGNGDQASTALYRRVCGVHNDFFFNQPSPRGGHYICGLWPHSLFAAQGKNTYASLDGRKAYEPVVDSVGPVGARATHGPTTVLQDVAALDASHLWSACYAFNMRFPAEICSSSEARSKLAALLETFFNMGGMQVQLNTLSSEILSDAMRNPQNYADLLVRVAGFSAYFTTLSTAIQQDIINRVVYEVG